LTSSETSVIWVAEEKYNWYTNNDLKILTFISSFVENNKIKKIVLIGMSGGGYASCRFACLLAKKFNNKNVLKIISIGINARTGIRKDLIERAGLMAAKVQWRNNAEDLSTLPFKSESYKGQICSLDKLDLVFQIDLI
jgi:pimeloyl-ACP methyl ester carboxylesterase